MRVIPHPTIKAMSGKILGEHSKTHVRTNRNGTVFICRNPRQKKAAFTAASALRKHILESATLRTNWSKRFSDAKKAGTTECSTLNGYLMKETMAGNIAVDGSYAG